MKIAKTILLFASPLVITACGSNFEWFPKVADTTPPVISAQIGTKAIFNNSSTITTLPANVQFASDEPATVYYTTNNSEPTTSSPSVAVNTAFVFTTGPSITLTGTILKFFGEDRSKNKSATVTNTIKAP